MKQRRLAISAIAAGLLVIAALPAATSARVTADPTSLTFAAQTVGVQTGPQAVNVQVFCEVPGGPVTCNQNDTFTPNPVFGGANPGDFVQANCRRTTTNVNANASRNCIFSIGFKPTAPGLRTATLILGTSTSGNGPPPIELTGFALAAPVIPPVVPAKKKCKKGKKLKKGKCVRKKAKRK